MILKVEYYVAEKLANTYEKVFDNREAVSEYIKTNILPFYTLKKTYVYIGNESKFMKKVYKCIDDDASITAFIYAR